MRPAAKGKGPLAAISRPDAQAADVDFHVRRFVNDSFTDFS
jgi:hypothetical protein